MAMTFRQCCKIKAHSPPTIRCRQVFIFFPLLPKAESLVLSAAITHEEALVKNKGIIVVVVRIDADLTNPVNCFLAAWQSLQIVYTEKNWQA